MNKKTDSLQTFDLKEGVAATCLLAILLGIAFTSDTAEVRASMFLWVGFVLACGLCLRLPSSTRIRRALQLGMPAAGFLLLTVGFVLWTSALVEVGKEMTNDEGQRVNCVAVGGTGSFGGIVYYVPVAEKTPVLKRGDKAGAEKEPKASEADKKPYVAGSKAGAFLMAFAFYLVVSVLTCVGVAVGAFARVPVATAIKVLVSTPAANLQRLEKNVNSIIRIALIVAGVVLVAL